MLELEVPNLQELDLDRVIAFGHTWSPTLELTPELPFFHGHAIAIDMALLYGLIWSFHLQYMQPALFYLKAPTQQYVYIFIALRALRFEVRYVVLAGIAALKRLPAQMERHTANWGLYEETARAAVSPTCA